MLAKGLPILLVASAIAATGCASEEKSPGSPNPATERSDHPAAPPPGWRTFANRHAGFTISLPNSWSARRRASATLIRSDDRLLAVTIAADRSEPGRTTPPRKYARRTFRALPGFRHLRRGPVRSVRHSPYATGRVDGSGVLAKRRQRQRITVAAFKRARRVTYTVVAFSAMVNGSAPHAASLNTLLASLRGRRPVL